MFRLRSHHPELGPEPRFPGRLAERVKRLVNPAFAISENLLPGSRRGSLRQEQRETFARATGFEKLRHWERMRLEAAFGESGAKRGTIFGQDDVFAQHNGVASEMPGLV